MSRNLGPGSQRRYGARLESGFIARYLSGDAVLDIGYRGGNLESLPITDKAIGIELDYPGYDGVRLPFDDLSQDAVFVSHCLEHIPDYRSVLADWYRVLKIGGFLVLTLPHQYLYERKATIPSRFNGDHKRFYTSKSLLSEVDESLPADGYRIRSLKEIDDEFDYSLPPEKHAVGCYEIELVIEKIKRPSYGARIGWKHIADASVQLCAEVVLEVAKADEEGREDDHDGLLSLLRGREPPPYILLEGKLAGKYADSAKGVLAELLESAPFDAIAYAKMYPDIALAMQENGLDARTHYLRIGYFEGRLSGITNAVFG
jgi:hypothetical protein